MKAMKTTMLSSEEATEKIDSMKFEFEFTQEEEVGEVAFYRSATDEVIAYVAQADAYLLYTNIVA